jgi:phospholipid/cholesterol/gamma-HCH transport system substrate-binding protein
MRARNRLVLLLIAAALAVSLSGCRFSLQGLPRPGGLSGPHYRITAQFDDVLNLPIGAQVRVGDGAVGQVESISAHDYVAFVRMDIRESVVLPTGTRAQVRFDAPLGSEFVQLTPPASGPPLMDGATITVGDTGTAPTVEDTFAALSYVLNGGGIQPLGVIVRELNKALDGHQAQARSLIEDLDSTLRLLAAHTADLDRAIDTLHTVSQQLAGGADVVGAGLVAAAPAMTVLAGQTDAFNRLTADVSQLSAVAQQAVDTSGHNTVADVQALVPVAQQLASLKAGLGPALSAIATFSRKLPTTTPGDYLQLSALVKGYLQNGAVPSQPATTTSPVASVSLGALLGGTP